MRNLMLISALVALSCRGGSQASSGEPVSGQSGLWDKAQKLDLVPVWGEENISGKSDLSAEARVFSDGKRLNLRVTVRDENLVISDDPLNSDHLELWFALPGLAETRAPEFFVYPEEHGVGFYWPLGGENEEALAAAFSEAISGPEDWDGSVPEELKQSKVFYGMTHLALYPDERPATSLDREFYKLLGDFDLGDPGSFIKYKADRTADGYEIVAVLPPEALGWIPGREFSEMLWLCDVVDVDQKKQESLLSSSGKRKWGLPSSFSSLRLEKPLVADINPADAEAVARLLGEHGSWYLSVDGWKPSTIGAYTTWYMGEFQWPHCCPKFDLVEIKPVKVEWTEEANLKKGKVDGIIGFWVDEKFMAACPDEKAIARAFAFPDGTRGLFLEWMEPPPGHPGMCGAALTNRAELWQNAGKEPSMLFELILNDCMPYMSITPGEVEELAEKATYPALLKETWKPPSGWTLLGEQLDWPAETWPVAYRFEVDKKKGLKAMDLIFVGSEERYGQEAWEVEIKLKWEKGKFRPEKVSEKRIN